MRTGASLLKLKTAHLTWRAEQLTCPAALAMEVMISEISGGRTDDFINSLKLWSRSDTDLLGRGRVNNQQRQKRARASTVSDHSEVMEMKTGDINGPRGLENSLIFK